MQDQLAKLVIPDQALQQSGFDINVQNIRILEFSPPDIAFGLSPPSNIKLRVQRGKVKVCAKWKVKKFFVSTTGDACVWTEDGKGLDAEVEIKPTVNGDGQIQLAIGECKFSVAIGMELKGTLGSVVNLGRGWIESMVQNQASAQFCKLVDDAVNNQVKKILAEMPSKFKVHDEYSVGYDVRSIGVTDGGARAQVGVNAIQH